MQRPRQALFVFAVLFITVAIHAQYKGDDIPGFLGLQSGTQAPPGLYVGNVVWVYPTDTIKDNNGNTIGQQRAQLTSAADVILVELVTNYKLLGAEVGFQAAVPFIKNRIQFNSLDISTVSHLPTCSSARSRTELIVLKR
jgi:hypothetical protein